MNKNDYAIYECEYYRVKVHKKSCFFCDNCTDVFFDSFGPYLLLCNKGQETTKGLKGDCEMYCNA